MPRATTRVITPLTRRDRVSGVAVTPSRFAPGLLVFVLFGSGTVSAADPPAADDPKALAFFESKVRPVLVENCYQCHSDRAGKAAGGLKLDSRAAIRAGGDRGAMAGAGGASAQCRQLATEGVEMTLRQATIGKRIIVTHGSGINSAKHGVIVPRDAVRIDRYNPRQWRAVKLDDGSFTTFPVDRLLSE